MPLGKEGLAGHGVFLAGAVATSCGEPGCQQVPGLTEGLTPMPGHRPSSGSPPESGLIHRASPCVRPHAALDGQVNKAQPCLQGAHSEAEQLNSIKGQSMPGRGEGRGGWAAGVSGDGASISVWNKQALVRL